MKIIGFVNHFIVLGVFIINEMYWLKEKVKLFLTWPKVYWNTRKHLKFFG